jgi:hypothetical protein
MTTLKELQEETDKYKDTLVLDFFEVKLFRQIVEDPDDFYYEFVDLRGKISLSSCVGWIMPLIDRLDKEQYNYLAQIWNLNNDIQIREI